MTQTQIESNNQAFATNMTTNILLIEDSIEDAEIISSYILKPPLYRDYDIINVGYLRDGLESLHKNDFDAVLLDLSLPDSMGIDTLIKVNDEFPHIPIIALTGQNDNELGINSVREGAQDFIPKESLNGTLIKRAIEYAIERKKTRIELEELNNNLDEIVKIRTQELHNEKQKVENKNDELLNNLKYAKHIQKAIMSQDRHFSQLFTESFVLNRPQKIVGGDFYWYGQIDNQIIVAIADCTGHGFSAALLSINCWIQFNHIILEMRETNPAIILKNLDYRVKASLESSRAEFQPNDGMDILVCSICVDTMSMQYAGANRPLVMFRDDELIRVNPTRSPVGGSTTNLHTVYDLEELDIEEGDAIYLFSDGFSDQFGGEKNKKLKRSPFINLLAENCKQPFKDQREIYSNFFDDWRGSNEQIDDVLLIGIKI